MNRITKKEAIKTIAGSKKINKIFLSLSVENELIKKVLINNQDAIIDNMKKAEIKLNSNSIKTQESYLYFIDIKESYILQLEKFKSVIIKTECNIIIYNIMEF